MKAKKFSKKVINSNELLCYPTDNQQETCFVGKLNLKKSGEGVFKRKLYW